MRHMPDEWFDEQDRIGEHMWLTMRDQDRHIDDGYPDDDWEQGYVDWVGSFDDGDPFPDLDEDDEAARWLAEHGG